MAVAPIKPQKEKMFEGNDKIFYYHEKEEYALIEHFKDTAYLSDGTITSVSGSGILRNSISAFLMSKLDLVGIDHHFIEKINMREQMVQMVDILPIKFVVSYLASGRYVTEFGMEEGSVFEKPMLDLKYKTSDKKYATVTEEQIMHLCYMNKYAVAEIKKSVIRASDFLAGVFAGAGIRLVESSFVLGTVFDGHEFTALIADEISPATCRLWDLSDNTKLDFERVMQNPEDTIEVYQEISRRLGIKA